MASSSTSSTSGETSFCPSSDNLWRSSSSKGASTSSSSHEGPSALGKSVLKRKGLFPIGLVLEIVAEGSKFLGAPTHSDPHDGLSSHFSDPKVVPTLKRTALEKQYLLPAGYTFVIPQANTTVNEPPTKCITVYRATLNYGL